MRCSFLVPLIALLTACDRADVRESLTITPEVLESTDGQFESIGLATFTVSPEGRDIVERWQVEAVVRITYSEGSPPLGDAYIATGLEGNQATESLDDGFANPRWEEVPFSACSDSGFNELDDGSCELSALLWITRDTDMPATLTANLRGWVSDGVSTEGVAIGVDLQDGADFELR